jgi:hypothetical protein
MQFEFSRHFNWLGSVSGLPLFTFLYTVFWGSSKTTELNTFSRFEVLNAVTGWKSRRVRAEVLI